MTENSQSGKPGSQRAGFQIGEFLAVLGSLANPNLREKVRERVKEETLKKYGAQPPAMRRELVSRFVGALNNVRLMGAASELLTDIAKTNADLVLELLEPAVNTLKTRNRAILLRHLEPTVIGLSQGLRTSTRQQAETKLRGLVEKHPDEVTEINARLIKDMQITEPIQRLLIHAVKLRTVQLDAAPTRQSTSAREHLDDVITKLVVKGLVLIEKGQTNDQIIGRELLKKLIRLSEFHSNKAMEIFRTLLLQDKERGLARLKGLLFDLNLRETTEEIGRIIRTEKEGKPLERQKPKGLDKPPRPRRI